MAALTRRTSDRGSRIGTLERGNRGWTWSKHKEGIDDGWRSETWIFKRRINNVMAPLGTMKRGVTAVYNDNLSSKLLLKIIIQSGRPWMPRNYEYFAPQISGGRVTSRVSTVSRDLRRTDARPIKSDGVDRIFDRRTIARIETRRMIGLEKVDRDRFRLVVTL